MRSTGLLRYAASLLLAGSVLILSGYSTPGNPTSSLLLLIDTSGSMGNEVGGGNSEIKIEAAKSAALAAVEQAAQKRDVEVAVLAFEGDCSQPVSRYHGFTTDFPALAGFINSLQPGGGTPMADAVLFANRFMENEGAPGARDHMIVLLADGQNDCGSVGDALSQLRASGVIFRHETVGFGIEPNSAASQDLQQIATASGGEYHHAADATQLGDLFMEFVNTFTLIDMLGTFGSRSSANPGNQTEQPTAQPRPSNAQSGAGQVTGLIGQFRTRPRASDSSVQPQSRPPAVPDDAQRVQEWNGLEVFTAARKLTPGAATCVVEDEYSRDFEQRKARYHGQPVDVWQLDFSVHNGSGRWLVSMYAYYSIAAEWPPCTSWPQTSAFSGYSDMVDWAGDEGFIQRISGNPVAPGETVTVTKFQYVYHEHEPRFDRWRLYNVSFGDSASAPGAAGQGGGKTR